MADSSRRCGNKDVRDAVEQEAVKTTIVGGRPPGSGRSYGQIPRGIEVLVKKAAVDSEFRKALIEKRAEAADEIGLALSSVEAAMLSSVPAAQIEKIIDNTAVPDEQRRVFLSAIGAAMLAVLVLDVSATAGTWVGGSRPDPPPPAPPPKALVPVADKSRRLGFEPIKEEGDSVALSVSCNCPFDEGELRVHLREHLDFQSRSRVSCKPYSSNLGRGPGKVTFRAKADKGVTRYVVIELRNRAPECRRLETDWPEKKYQLGDFVVGNCVFWKIAEYRKA